ncbi:hypothetical protein BDN70DRAFT_923529 [Pholiota conissans]|uniref:F-box domain-containing protein n=1 Tax=Pholiota conissans TaxID=109636 RepID=A0A9P5YY98_9AGAR|nr:hypothetical protein BDN70DRAFT_923529 [Pholiota conissans]
MVKDGPYAVACLLEVEGTALEIVTENRRTRIYEVLQRKLGNEIILMLSEPIINSLPTEMLGEIFVRCLPDYPLEVRQPDPTTAPILLCHVCSLWRTIVFGTPSLWTCLYVLLPIRRLDSKHPTTWDPKHLLAMVEFMEWWRVRQGSDLGTTSICIKFPQEQDAFSEPVAEDVIKFIARCISSAKHIDIAHGFYFRLLLEAGLEFLNPRPNILIVNCGEKLNEHFMYIMPFEVNIPSTVRRLSIQIGSMPASYDWSFLSHLSLGVGIDSKIWHALIRGLLNLHYGDFHVAVPGLQEATYHIPHHTLPFLTSLRINFDNVYDREATEPPLVLLFHNLHLPKLNDLTLLSEHDEWRHPGPIGALFEVQNLLRSSPALKQVTLTPHFLCFGKFLHRQRRSGVNVMPLISLAPSISHLRLLLPFECNAKLSSWCDAFSHMHWFGFKRENTAVLMISVVVQTGSSISVGVVKAMIERRLKIFLMEFEGKTLSIGFAVSWDQEKKEEGLRAAGFFS